MPPNDKPLATMRRPRVDMAAIEAIGSRWEQRAPLPAADTASPQTSERSDVATSKLPLMSVPAPIASEGVAPKADVPTLSTDLQVSAPPTASASASDNTPSGALHTEASVSSRAIVARVGRQLADGSRRGAKTLRRMTVYLEPARASQLAVRCAKTGETMSDVIDRALAAYLTD